MPQAKILAQPGHKTQIMQGRQPLETAITDLEQVVQITAGITAANRAVASNRNGTGITHETIIRAINVIQPIPGMSSGCVFREKIPLQRHTDDHDGHRGWAWRSRTTRTPIASRLTN